MSDTHRDPAEKPEAGEAATLAHVNRALPLVRSIARTIIETHRALDSANRRADQYAERIDQLGSRFDRDAYMRELADEIHDLDEELIRQAAEIRELGGCVVDPANGAIDFDGELGGQLVALCWQPGDGSIGYYHGIDEECSERRALDSSPAASHA